MEPATSREEHETLQNSPMISNSLRWLIHWTGQGLKLWFFATVASLFLLPLYLPLELLDNVTLDFGQLGWLAKILAGAGYIACFALGIAVFTAVLASQLRDHPLRPFTPRPNP